VLPPVGLPLVEDEIADISQALAGLGQTMAVAGILASSLTQDMLSAALDGGMAADGGAVSPLIVGGSAFQGGPYVVSGYKHRSHDGYSVESSLAPSPSVTPGFEEENYGLTIGGRFDGSELLGASPNSVTFGVLGNYTRTEIDIDAPGGFPGLTSGGSATVDSWSVGSFALVTDGAHYGVVSVTGTFGSPETEAEIVGPVSAAFNNYAVATSAVAGVLIPMGGTVRLDLRGGLDYVYARSDDFEDSIGVEYTDGHTEELAGNVSARLFGVLKTGGYDVRPFLQAGLSHRFLYENELKVAGIAFSFDEADTSVFGRAGIDFSLSESAQAYVAVRGDASEDFEAIAAQVGLTFKLD
jgi:outer membrane autotransporter protein